MESIDPYLIHKVHPTDNNPSLQINRNSTVHEEKSFSFGSIFTITNAIISSTVVLIGVEFQRCGLVTSLITMLIISGISYKTCLIVLKHIKHNECDFSEILERILGRKWSILFRISSFSVYFILGIIYFVLSCNLLYSSIQYFRGYNIPTSTNIDFKGFSFQYLGLIVSFFMFFVLCIEKISWIVKIGQMGVFALLIFIAYTIYKAIRNIDNISHINIIDKDPFQWFQLAGIYSLSFNLQNSLLPILSQRSSSNSYKRNLTTGFTISVISFTLIGVFGSIATANVDLVDSFTFLDVIDPCALTSTLKIVLVFEMLTAIPITWSIAKKHFIDTFSLNRKIGRFQNLSMNFAYCLIAWAIQILNLPKFEIVAITGAIGGFVLIYIIPIFLHIACLSRNKTENQMMHSLINMTKVIEEKVIENRIFKLI